MRYTHLLPLLCPALLAAQAANSVGRVLPQGIPRFPIDNGSVNATGAVRVGAFVGDVGRQAALLGEESGNFEAWVWPVKLVRDLRLAFRSRPGELIDGGTLARQVIVRAEGATIVYSHPSFTLREHLFVPVNEPGAILLLEAQTVNPLEVVVRATADFNLAWPGRLNAAAPTWDAVQRRIVLTENSTAGYIGLLGSPAAVAGGVARGAAELVVRIEPRSTEYIPIVIAGGRASVDSVAAAYQRLLSNAARSWRDKSELYRRVRDDLLSIETPDTRLDQALAWSKVNLEQSIVCSASFGCGPVAGYGRSGAGNFRPGRAWYFGSAGAEVASAAVATGQLEVARSALLFLAKQQRADGKIPREISQAAATLPWSTQYPFAWTDAEATPLFILAAAAHWQGSNDSELLRQLWPAVVKAFRWSGATDTDGDGLMETPRAGSAALEAGSLALDTWSDVYLAGVWVAALEATAALASVMRDEEVAESADALRARAARTLESAFWLPRAQFHAFAILRRDQDSNTGAARPVSGVHSGWPAVPLSYGLLDRAQADFTLRELASSALTSDWGVRPLSRYDPLYAPIEAGNGAVSTHLSGVAAAAHFRYHRAWSGYDLLRDMARASFDFGRGRTPDVVSGSFYSLLEDALPQSTAGSTALITAVVRGLFGLEADAGNRAFALEPHLPGEWSSASVSNYRVGADRVSVNIQKQEQRWIIDLSRAGTGPPLFVRLAPALPLGATVTSVRIDDRDAPVQTEDTPHDVHPVVELALAAGASVEIEYTGGVELVTPGERVEAGDPAESLRVLDFRRSDRAYILVVEGLPGATYSLGLRTGVRVRAVSGAELIEQAGERAQLRVRMPPSNAAFVRREVIVRT